MKETDRNDYQVPSRGITRYQTFERQYSDRQAWQFHAKITRILKCTFKTSWSFFKKEKNFGTLAILMVKTLDRQCHGADLWQIPLQLFLDVCPQQSQTAVWGEGGF